MNPFCCPCALLTSVQFSRCSVRTNSGVGLEHMARETSTIWPCGVCRPVRETALGTGRDIAERDLGSGAEERGVMRQIPCLPKLRYFFGLVGATESFKNFQCSQMEHLGMSLCPSYSSGT